MPLQNDSAYVKEVKFGVEKIDQETRKVCVTTFVVAIDPVMAARINVALPSKLYDHGTGEPCDDVAKMFEKLDVEQIGPHNLDLRMSPDQESPSVHVSDAKVRATGGVKVRRDKEHPVFEATLVVDFPYPAAKDLMFIAKQHADTVYATLTPMQPSMTDE